MASTSISKFCNEGSRCIGFRWSFLYSHFNILIGMVCICAPMSLYRWVSVFCILSIDVLIMISLPWLHS